MEGSGKHQGLVGEYMDGGYSYQSYHSWWGNAMGFIISRPSTKGGWVNTWWGNAMQLSFISVRLRVEDLRASLCGARTNRAPF
eukprot:3269038-Pyramimonas_sp.AAC.1